MNLKVCLAPIFAGLLLSCHPEEKKVEPNIPELREQTETEKIEQKSESSSKSLLDGKLNHDPIMTKLDDLVNHDKPCATMSDRERRKQCFDEVELSFSDAYAPLKNARRERILVVESPIASNLALAYRSRFVDTLTIRDGQIVKNDPTLRVPRNLKAIFDLAHEARAIKPYPFKDLSGDELMDLECGLEQVYREYREEIVDGHNHWIVRALLENNPEHEIVTLENMKSLDQLYGQDLICKPKVDLILEKARDIRLTVTRMLKDYRIGYINMSIRYGRHGMEPGFISSFQRFCSNQQLKNININQIEAAFDEGFSIIFEAFANNEKAIIVQSAATSTWGQNYIDLDEARFPHRIRAGAMNYVN